MATAKTESRERRQQILAETVKQAARVGLSNVTRQGIAAALKVSPALVSLYFGTMPQLRRDVMRYAISVAETSPACPEALRVIAQGLAIRDRVAMRAPQIVQCAASSTLYS